MLLLMACSVMDGSTMWPAPVTTDASVSTMTDVLHTLDLPDRSSEQRTALHGDTVYVWVQWSKEEWPRAEEELGASRNRYAHTEPPSRPLPAPVVATLFGDENPYGDPLNSAAFPQLLRTNWGADGVEWALLLGDRSVLVRVDVGTAR